MANCPLCQAPVPDDFGLIECASCGAALIVHMDGHVEHSGSDAETAPPLLADVEPENFEFSSGGDDVPTSPAVPIDEAEPLAAEGSYNFLSEEKPEVAPEAEPNIEPEPEAELAVYSAGPAHDPASPDLSDIAAFGNSESSSGREGSLRYRIFVSGIDTADVREEFREAITDRKMMWDTEQILRSIKNGEIEFANISALKAHILVSRLRNLPLQIRWEQYAVAQT